MIIIITVSEDKEESTINEMILDKNLEYINSVYVPQSRDEIIHQIRNIKLYFKKVKK